VLIAPAHSIAVILDIITFTLRFKLELLVIAAINIVACFAFERYAERPITRAIAQAKRMWRGRRGRRGKHGEHQYKAIEGNMR
jgi:cation-transporting ATPase 13A2